MCIMPPFHAKGHPLPSAAANTDGLGPSSTDASIPGGWEMPAETESGGLNPPSVREYGGVQDCSGGQIAAPTAF